MNPRTFLVVCCFYETIAASMTGRYYDKQKESRVLATRTNRYELGQSRSSIMPIECLTKCNQLPACRAVNAFKNGTCEVVLSPVIGVEVSAESTAYIGSYEECPAGFGYPLVTRAYGSCYKFVLDQSKTWDEARDHCVSLGGDLVAIETAEEMDHLTNTVRSDPQLHGTGFWSSGTDVDEEGEWRWNSTGARVDYSLPDYNDITGENTENCLFIGWSDTSFWKDSSCYMTFLPLCEVALD